MFHIPGKPALELADPAQCPEFTRRAVGSSLLPFQASRSRGRELDERTEHAPVDFHGALEIERGTKRDALVR
jgi:hypothetical protein